MPWATPTLRQVRETVRGEITTALGRASFVGNSVLRVIADAEAALTHLVLRYIDWLSLQLMPDTAETEWLDRHGDIWLTNADGTTGRKSASAASGTVTFTGSQGVVVPTGTQLTDGTVMLATTSDTTLSSGPTNAAVTALTLGKIGNLESGSQLGFVTVIPGVDGSVTVTQLTGGADVESDDDLRERVLRRIQQPPMGGAQHDYEAWALQVPGVTRAWAVGNEMGIGTVTLRFMMDELRVDNDGFPLQEDIDRVWQYVDSKRPVTVKDFWVVAPLRHPITFDIHNLVPDTASMRASIEANIKSMLKAYSAPGQTIFAAWKYAAVMGTPGVVSFEMSCDDDVMPSPGHIATLGSVIYDYSDMPSVASAPKPPAMLSAPKSKTHA